MPDERELHLHDVAEQVDEPRPAGPRAPFGVEHAEELTQHGVVLGLEVERRWLAVTPNLDRVLVGEPVGRRLVRDVRRPRQRSDSSASTCSSCGSSSFTSAETRATSPISRCLSSPSARPIALPDRFCSARSSSTRTVSDAVARRGRGSVDGVREVASGEALRKRSGSSGSPGRRAPRPWPPRPRQWPLRRSSGLLRRSLCRLLVHDRLPLEDPPSSTTSVFEVMSPSTRPPRASSARPLTVIVPLNLPATTTFCARMSASTWLCGESRTSPSALICPFTCPSIRSDPAETTVPSSLAPCPTMVTSPPCRLICHPSHLRPSRIRPVVVSPARPNRRRPAPRGRPLRQDPGRPVARSRRRHRPVRTRLQRLPDRFLLLDRQTVGAVALGDRLRVHPRVVPAR